MKTILHTIVIGALLLGAVACHKAKPAPTTPANTSSTPAPDPKADPAAHPVTTPATPTPGADPCGG